jgi:hypothetical protein
VDGAGVSERPQLTPRSALREREFGPLGWEDSGPPSAMAQNFLRIALAVVVAASIFTPGAGAATVSLGPLGAAVWR